MQLRPYQQEAVTRTLLALNDLNSNPLVVLPTGAGKSAIIGALINEISREDSNKKNTSNPPLKILVLAHRKELLTQNAKTIENFNPKIKITYYSNAIGKKDLSGDVVIAGIASIFRTKDLPSFSHVFIDEAHMVNNREDGMYRDLLKQLSARVIGLSATPFRIRGGYLHKGPTKLFTEISYEISISQLMMLGFLCPLTNKASAVDIDLSGLHTRAGEFIQSEYDEIFNEEKIVEAAVQDIMHHAYDRRSWLLFCSSVEHAQNVSKALIKNNINSAVIVGNTPKEERERILQAFKDGHIRALTNCDVLTTGFDAPNIDMIALLRPTQSPGLYIQCVGRGTRLHPDKINCLVLDYGGNILRFGPVDKIKLKDNFQKIEPEDIPLKVCPKCREVIHIKEKACQCGYVWPVKEVKRTVKHDIRASTLTVLAANKLAAKFDGQTELEIIDHKFMLHFKKDKPPSVRIDHHLNMLDCVSEWVCPEHIGFAKMKANNWWKEHAPTKPPKNVEEFLARRDELNMPKKIKVKLNGNFPEIIERII